MHDSSDVEARGAMMLGATLAGVGFGAAGCHIPHGCAYPIAGLKHTYQPSGYPNDHPFVPHGFSVIVTAPAAFRFTYEAAPERHDHVASLLAPDSSLEYGPDTLPEVLTQLMRDVGAPRGVGALGYDESDLADLVAGAMKQQRLLVISPREADESHIRDVFAASMTNW